MEADEKKGRGAEGLHGMEIDDLDMSAGVAVGVRARCIHGKGVAGEGVVLCCSARRSRVTSCVRAVSLRDLIFFALDPSLLRETRAFFFSL